MWVPSVRVPRRLSPPILRSCRTHTGSAEGWPVTADLLIIDDIGLKKLPPESVQDLHDLLEERQSKSTVFTTQLPLKNWKEIIDDELALDSIVDKLKHGTIEIKIEGETYRKKRGQTNVT